MLGYLVAKHFLGPEKQLSALWQRLIMPRISKEAEKVSRQN